MNAWKNEYTHDLECADRQHTRLARIRFSVGGNMELRTNSTIHACSDGPVRAHSSSHNRVRRCSTRMAMKGVDPDPRTPRAHTSLHTHINERIHQCGYKSMPPAASVPFPIPVFAPWQLHPSFPSHITTKTQFTTPALVSFTHSAVTATYPCGGAGHCAAVYASGSYPTAKEQQQQQHQKQCRLVLSLSLRSWQCC